LESLWNRIRADDDENLLERTRRAVHGDYAALQDHPSAELINIAALARELSLLADLQTDPGKRFWTRADRNNIQ
jgi:hypothetical protein